MATVSFACSLFCENTDIINKRNEEYIKYRVSYVFGKGENLMTAQITTDRPTIAHAITKIAALLPVIPVTVCYAFG